MFDIVGRRGWWYLVSTVLLAPGIVALLTGGLKPGIDFTGGTLLQVRVAAETTQEDVTSAAQGAGFPEAVVQMAGESDALLRVRAIDVDEKDDLLTGLGDATGPVEELGFSAIGPVVGEELTRAAIIAVAVASALILLYVTWAFRGMQHSFRYGVAAIVALLHDALFVLGVFAILGHAFNVQIDALFVTALLTVIGFSVNDSIVVFDRIRETNRDYVHLDDHERPGIASIINHSANQSLTRSLNTSFTALLVLLALLLLGGPTIRDFVLALSLGFAIGTYSSIFNAACLVASWENRDIPRLWRRVFPWRRASTT
ncbi:MAG: protein translocase subunit SecF [Chloroflexi bacterium]|nr:protein translocase subunit SecF [Chloroflexota bacterium]